MTRVSSQPGVSSGLSGSEWGETRDENKSTQPSLTGGGFGGHNSSMPPDFGNPPPLQVTANLDPDSPEIADRRVKGLLNKLTMENFDSISGQIIEWANKSEEEKDGRTLLQVIRLVFEHAIDDERWSEMYVRLCRKMMEQISPKVQDDDIKNTEGKPIADGQLFCKYLLNRCQDDFERGWVAKEAIASGEANNKIVLYSDKYYAAQKAKRQGLGLIKFIGELFKVQMLTERILHECVKKLLGNVETPEEEEEIESLCKLISTELGKSNNVSSRMQFMLQDVIELRDCKWVKRTQVAAPGLSSPQLSQHPHRPPRPPNGPNGPGGPSQMSTGLSSPRLSQHPHPGQQGMPPQIDLKSVIYPPVDRQCSEDAPARSSIWYQDGSVVLQAENTQFRVHWGVLGAQSLFFCDMQDLPQPPDQPTVDGCAIVEMQDTALDVGYLLKALYDSMFFLQKALPLPAVAALIRLGRKYKFRNFFNTAVERLTFENPTTLEEYDAQMDNNSYKSTRILHYPGVIFDMLTLARENIILSVLPCVYYRALDSHSQLELFDGIPRGDDTVASLASVDQRRYIHARGSGNGPSTPIFAHILSNVLESEPKFRI
ncbi:armadillo-type protein [Mycena alexandri]|uniref:Armadillo-type protein n=1 Tax=Mycena alexandri TaxID=1745969 RepID=A0AAD6S114_9AGAR|nr:armadillo-type protein [Mycena alexandri]